MRAAMVWLLFPGASCLPDADLFDEGPASGSPGGGGPAAELIEPVAGAMDVPRNLAAVVVRLPAEPAGSGEVVRLRIRGGAAVPAGDLVRTDCGAAGVCFRLPLAAPLAS